MHTLERWLVSALAAGSVVVCAGAAAAQPGQSTPSVRGAEALPRAALALAGRIEGQVTDERGQPVPGAAITAHGARFLLATSDTQGRFAIESVQPGPYLVRAQHTGFAASRRNLVEVTPAGSAWQTLRLQRLAAAAARPSVDTPVVAAGFAQAGAPDAVGEAGASTSGEADEHSHSPLAWRLRHLKRSVLREAGHDGMVDAEAFDPGATASPGVMASLVQPGAGFDSALWADGLAGEVQFLTTSSFDSPQELFATNQVPRGVAYVAFGSPAGSHTTWAVQGALTQGDLSSWVLGGSFTRPMASSHELDVELSYGMQRYDGGNPLALAAVADGNRRVGTVAVSDRWRFLPNATLVVGSRYEKYDYIDGNGLLSPSLEMRWMTSKGVWLRAAVARRALAPGAEEFVPSPVAGQWLPPQRTFSPLTANGFQHERSNHVEFGIERQVATWIFSARAYRQIVSDQLLAAFGERVEGMPRADIGHYRTGNTGDLEAYGWSIGLSRPLASRIRGSVEYTLAHARWADDSMVVAAAGLQGRSPNERLHDVTALVETEIPETATRVYAAYKLNTGYAKAVGFDQPPGFDARFDVRVTQGLPFLGFTRADWEVLVAVRNLFREQLVGASVYDELLVVRPPKRIVGGLMVRF